MTSFKAGFFKYAAEQGFSEAETEHLFKQAEEYPPTEQMFRDITPTEESSSPEELETLAELLKQHALNAQLHLPDVHRINP
jgi:hypothetical protein